MPELASWGGFAAAHPALAEFGAGRLSTPPAYLATIRADGSPRVHPVTPIIGGGRLFIFMEPTSPKGDDLRQRHLYALHSGVPDQEGSGGEFIVHGTGASADDPAARALATAAASYKPAERYILFELGVDEAHAKGYGDVEIPEPRHWKRGAAG